MTTRTLTVASLKMFVRNKQAMFFTLVMPFIFIGIFGLIGFDKPQVIDIGIVVSNPTPQTRSFLDELGKISAFKIFNGSEADERKALQSGDRQVVVLVPDDLFATRALTVLKHAAYEQQVQTALTIINQFLDKASLTAAKAEALVTVNVESVNARKVRYIDFLLPGIIAMSIMQMSVFSVAFLFADYKEKGILKRLLATPMTSRQFVTSQVITRVIVALVQSVVLLVIGMLIFKTHVYGSWLLVLLLIFLGSLLFLGLGFTISGLAKTVDAVPAIANIIIFPMLFLSGIFFPTSTMPVWLQKVVTYLPLEPFAKALRNVVGNGDGLAEIKTELFWVIGWAVTLFVLAIFTFRMEEKRV